MITQGAATRVIIRIALHSAGPDVREVHPILYWYYYCSASRLPLVGAFDWIPAYFLVDILQPNRSHE